MSTRSRNSDSGRERTAACAALLGDVCRAGADDVSGALLGQLSERLLAALTEGAEAAHGGNGAAQLRILAHGRCELLMQVSRRGAVDVVRQAVVEAARRVEQDLKLSVPIQVEVDVVAGA